uniref:SPT2 chromatin protein n=1 Tax=Davidia involucrata TaxID=16924 RepID=A0A5B7ALY7_DAVIN
MPTGSQMQPKMGSHKLTSASKPNLTSVDSRKQLGRNNGNGPGWPLRPRGLPFKTPAATMEKKVSAPPAKSSMPVVHKPPSSKLQTSIPKRSLEQKKEIQTSIPKRSLEQKKEIQVSSKAKLIPKQPMSSSRPQINKPPAKLSAHYTLREDRPKKKHVCQYSDDEEAISRMVRRMFGYNPSKFAGCDDDDDSDMEANFDDIMREEKRSAKIAKKEDEEELLKIEEENRREWLRKEAKEHKLSRR